MSDVMEVDLSQIEDLSPQEFAQAKAQIDKALEQKRAILLDKFVEQIMREAEKLGIPPSELADRIDPHRVRRHGLAGKKVPWKYRHPTDPAKGWSGRGLAPKWLVEWELQGNSREDLLIQ